MKGSKIKMIYINRIEIDTAGLAKSGSYVANLPLIENFTPINFDSPVTFFVGENGSGKSTLIEAIAVAAGFNSEGGGRNYRFSTRATHSELCNHIKLVRSPVGKWHDGYFLRAESFYNVASYIEDIDNSPGDPSPHIAEAYGVRSLHAVSHGEGFLALMKNRFFGNGLYILDEPEAALSPTGIISLMLLMRELVGKNSQFIISTHSPILTGYPGASIYQISSSGIKKTEWKRTDNYILTKRFLDSPGIFLGDI